MQNLFGLTRNQIATAILPLGLKPFRAQQIYHWVYAKGITSFAKMSNISPAEQHLLQNNFALHLPQISKCQSSRDGTQKWLLKLEDTHEIECVHIPERSRGTLCVSSQIGCTLTCRFCHTGTQRLVRNLTPAEILAQVYIARTLFNDWNCPQGQQPHLTHIVFMGMGEPLFNYDNVAQAIQMLMDPKGLAIPKRKITVSTSGVVPEIQRCGHDLGVNLAISLHATRDDLRSKIMPINNKYPLKTLLDACRSYPGLSKSNRITFEYVLLKDMNDSVQDAYALVQLLKGIPAKINLIPFNPWPGSTFERSSEQAVHRFANVLVKAGYASPIRRPRGEDILAACGQLKSASQKIKKILPLNAVKASIPAS